MRRWLVRGTIAGILVAILVALRFTLFAPRPVPVEYVLAARGPVEQTVTNSRAGTVKARTRAKLSPEIGGRVVRLPCRRGDRVAAGDVVLELDSSLQRAHLDLARRDAATAHAQSQQACLAAGRAARELGRTRKLAEEKILSADLLDEVESAARSAAAACDAGQAGEQRALAAVAVAERELDKTVLRAPFAGVVAELTAELGEYSTPSPPGIPVPPAIDLLDPSSIYVAAPMDEVDSARLHLGQPTKVTVDSHPGRQFPAHLVRMAPYVLDVQEQNRTVEVEAELEDPALAVTLLPGTSADIEVILASREDVLRLPTSALLAGGRALVVEGDRLVERQLELGLRNWDWTEVTGGLAAGDRVVVSLDRPEVKAGAKVAATARTGNGA